MRRDAWGWLCLLVCLSAQAESFRSNPAGSHLVELYTSEGCSSCPPADRWLAGFAGDPALFRTLYPVGFHVDYWNRLGWPDRFSSARYSERQRAYSRRGYLSQVYTPGLVINGREWRGWFAGHDGWERPPLRRGTLELDVDGRELRARFDGSGVAEPVLHLVRLGMGLESRIARGENRGKTLRHDFVVLEYRQLPGPGGTWTVPLSPLPDQGQRRTALVGWVGDGADPAPLQVAGGYLGDAGPVEP